MMYLASRTPGSGAVVVPDWGVVGDERVVEAEGLLPDSGEVTTRLQCVAGGVSLDGEGVELVRHQLGLELGG